MSKVARYEHLCYYSRISPLEDIGSLGFREIGCWTLKLVENAADELQQDFDEPSA